MSRDARAKRHFKTQESSIAGDGGRGSTLTWDRLLRVRVTSTKMRYGELIVDISCRGGVLYRITGTIRALGDQC